jgi:hypothetical protein
MIEASGDWALCCQKCGMDYLGFSNGTAEQRILTKGGGQLALIAGYCAEQRVIWPPTRWRSDRLYFHPTDFIFSDHSPAERQ